MRLKCRNSGQIVACNTLLGAGGEGEVYATDIAGMVAKVYHPGKTPALVGDNLQILPLPLRRDGSV